MNYYKRWYNRIWRRGIVTHPRGLTTRAVFNETFSFWPGKTVRREHDNPAIGLLDGLQLLAGTDNIDNVRAAAPNARIDLFGPNSFYGPRIAAQVPRVIREIEQDRNTRRAVIMIANQNETPETLTCTTSVQFYMQGFSLYSIYTMRSSDAVWGLPYDMIQFGILSKAVANVLRCPDGLIMINIGNAHIYENTHHPGRWLDASFSIPHFMSWDEYVAWAQKILKTMPTRKQLEQLFQLRLGE